MISPSKFKIRIEEGGRERWADADKVFAHLLKNYMKAELKGKKPEPYKDKVSNFFRQIDKDWVEALREAYPNVDVDQELENAKMWLLSNTNQAKSNFKKFINNWMAKAMRTGEVGMPTNFKSDSTGNFYMGYCEKCSISDFYRKEELRGDSKCHNAKLLPAKP